MLNRFLTDNWQKYLMLLFALFGIGLFASGVVSAIAANWHYFSKFEKLFAAQFLLVGLIALGLFFYRREAGRQMAYFKTNGGFFLAAVTIGALFALIGQIYQTGADLWQLFALWSALQLPLLLARPNIASALLLCVTLNCTLWLSDIAVESRCYFSTLLNFGLLLLAEYWLHHLKDSWRIVPRVLMVALSASLFGAVAWFGERFGYLSWAILVAWLPIGALFAFYRWRRFDIFNLVLCFCYTVLSANWLILVVFEQFYALDAVSWLSFLLNIGALVFGVMWLHQWFKAHHPDRDYSVALELFFLFLAVQATGFFVACCYLIFTPIDESDVLLVAAVLLFIVGFFVRFQHQENLLGQILFAMAMLCACGYLIWSWDSSRSSFELLIALALFTAVYLLNQRKWLKLLAAVLSLISLFGFFLSNFFYGPDPTTLSLLERLFYVEAVYWLGLAYLACYLIQPKLSVDLKPLAWSFLLATLFWAFVYPLARFNFNAEAPPLPEIQSWADFIAIITQNAFSRWDLPDVLNYLLCFSPLMLFVALNRGFRAPNSRVIFGGILLFVLAFIASPIFLFAFSMLLLAYAHRSRAMFSFGLLLSIGFLSAYYYWLAIPLLYKAFLLLVCGLAFLLLAGYLYRQTCRSVHAHAPVGKVRQGVFVAAVGTLLLTLGVANLSIWQNEAVLKEGDAVVLKLAPVDPRSLMQGDYMELNYALLDVANAQLAESYDTLPRKWYLQIQRNENGVAQFCRLTAEEPRTFDGCQANLYLPLKLGESGFTLPGQQFFFEEGRAFHFAQAEYGEFRVKAGKALLLRLLDGNQNPL